MKIGDTFANRQSIGTHPVDNDRLKIIFRGVASSLQKVFRNLEEIPSGPGAESGFNFVILSLICFVVHKMLPIFEFSGRFGMGGAS